MRLWLTIALIAAGLPMAGAQTATHTAHAPVAKHAAETLPPGIPRAHAVMKTAFTLRYQDIKAGTGAEAEPDKLYKVFYSVWIAADGRLLDSTDTHREELKDAEGKPVLDADGKPKLSEPQPLMFVQGMSRLIPGFAEGFGGMHVGGKRRLFIPWQLAYGAKGKPGPDAAHAGVPPKADLIFDVELAGMEDAPAMGHMPMMPNGMHPGTALPPGHPAIVPKPAESTQPQ